MDEIELRIKNGNYEDSETYFGQIIGSCEYEQVLRKGRELSHWDDIHGKRARNGMKVRGIGLASCINVGGGARDQGDSDSSGCVLIMQDDGSVTVNTGGQEIGSGGSTVFAQIVAEELGVSISRVHLEQSDTDLMPWDIGAHAQRNVFCAGNAVLSAAREAKAILSKEISRQLNCAESDISTRNGNVYIAGDPEPRATIMEIARSAHFRPGGQLIWGKGFYDPPTVKTDSQGFGNQSAAYSFGAQFAEVEVDLGTGHIDVIRLVGTNDVGVAINPVGVQGQIEGGALQGIGQATTELMHIESGELLNPMMYNYGVPTALDAPQIVAHAVESSEPTGPFGAKGVGEATVVPTCAAVANAVYDATGVRITELPLSPERVLDALDGCDQEGKRR
jgi:CO/xanthine dehydrogenase Mo-binding subunit